MSKPTPPKDQGQRGRQPTLRPTQHRNRRETALGLGVLVTYALLTTLLTYPIAFRVSRSLPDHDIDIWVSLWTNWWFRQAVFHGRNLYFTPLLFHPNGVSLIAHSSSPLFSAVSALLFPLLGEIGAYNTSMLAIFVVGAWGMYLLVREITGHRAAAFVAGLTYAFAPYYLSQGLAHPSLASVQWLPYLALSLRRTLHDGRIRHALGASAFFSLTVWSGLQLGLLASLWAVAFVAWTIAGKGRAWRQIPWLALGVAALGAVLLSAPALIPVWRAWGATAPPQDLLLNEWERGQTDLLAYLIPPRYHPLWGSLVTPISERFLKNRKWIPYLGICPLGLAIYAALKEKRARFWWISGLLWILLALGAVPRLNGHTYPAIRLPYALLGRWFPFNTLRSSDRFNLLVPLSLAPLVGVALARLGRGTRALRRIGSGARVPRALRRIGSSWWVVLAAGVIAFEYLFVPIPTQPPLPLPPFISEMAADPEPYAVLDLPMGRQFSKLWMYLQTMHKKPLVEGMVARTPPQAYALAWSTPLVQAFQSPEMPAPDDISTDLCRLSGSGVRYILIHRHFSSDEDLQRWLPWFRDISVHPAYENERLSVYPTDPDHNCPADLSAEQPVGIPLAYRLGEKIRLVTWNPRWEGPVRPGDVLHFTLYWACDSPPNRSLHVFNHLMAERRLVAQGDGPPVDGQYPTDFWQTDDLIADQRSVVVPDDLPPGRYALLAGLYSLETKKRLPATDDQGTRFPNDAIPLDFVEVQ